MKCCSSGCWQIVQGIMYWFLISAKIRRLYDIANILTSLGLIRKVHVTEVRGRKPAFKYIGPELDDCVKDVHGESKESAGKKSHVQGFNSNNMGENFLLWNRITFWQQQKKTIWYLHLKYS